MTEQRTYIMEVEYRSTNRGGKTYYYILTANAEELEPRYMRRSRTGNHGEDCYKLNTDEVYYAVKYTRSNNSMNKRIEVYKVINNNMQRMSWEDVPENIQQFVKDNFEDWEYIVV